MRTVRTRSANNRLSRSGLLPVPRKRRTRRAAFVLYPPYTRWDVSFSVLQPARFVSRPNRFRIVADVESGTVDVACADPGRLRELLRAGVALQLLPASGATPRRTAHTALLVRHRRLW